MNTFTYDMSALAPDDRTFFREMIPYLSEHVQDIHREGDVITIDYDDAISEADMAAKVAKLEGMLATQLKGSTEQMMAIKNLFDATGTDPVNHDDVFERLLAEGQIVRLNTGSFAYSGLFAKVKRYFERRVELMADDIFGDYTYYEMPDLIPIGEYEKGGYFDTFPQYTMFQTTLKNDIEVIDRFSRDKTSDPTIFEEIKRPANVLRTAACMPLYPILEHARIPADKPGKYVVVGHCFRYEEGNLLAIERLNEFTMKELVCVGTPEQTSAFITRAKQEWLNWQEVFGLNLRIDTANDSFFASNYKKLKLFQILGDSKVECRWLIPGTGHYISCSSANAHRTHFTKTYDIRTAETDAYCYTSCFAFGIDRLTYALLSQLGLDVDAWSDAARAEVERCVRL